MNEIRYAELFAGVGGFREGIEQAESYYNSEGGRCVPDSSGEPLQHSGCSFHCVYASELDKHASAVYRHIWQANGELHEGDISEQKTEEVPDLDLLTAGFPCQSFSVAGKLGGFQDTRGTLFFEVARFLADKRPRHFLLENVKNLVGHDNGKTFQTILGVLADLGYRVEWEVLNSTCWVPQNRERVFIVGHLRGECGCQVFPLREDDGLYPEAFGQDKVANCIDSNYWKGWLDKGQRTMVAHTAFKGDVRFYENETPTISTPASGGHLPYVGKVGGGGFSDNRVCSDVAPTLMGCAKGDDGHQSGISHRNPIVIHENKSGTQTPHNEAVALRVGASHNYQKVSVSAPRDGKFHVHRNDEKKSEIQGLSFFDSDTDHMDIIDAHPKNILEGQRFRRLTPIECERLQGWKDNHTAIGLYRATDLPKSRRNRDEYVMDLVSDIQRYRMTGNGVTADVVREVIKKMILVGCFDG